MAIFLCELAKLKGRITLFYLLEGLAKLVHFKQVLEWKSEKNISNEQIGELVKQPKKQVSRTE